MCMAYGSKRLAEAQHDREQRKRLVHTYESDLQALLEEGLKVKLHPDSYPDEIRPLWRTLEAIPDDPDDALAFWTEDGASDHRLTDQAPNNKFKRLLQARILGFDLSPQWRQDLQEGASSRPRGRRTFFSNHSTALAGAIGKAQLLTPETIKEHAANMASASACWRNGCCAARAGCGISNVAVASPRSRISRCCGRCLSFGCRWPPPGSPTRP